MREHSKSSIRRINTSSSIPCPLEKRIGEAMPCAGTTHVTQESLPSSLEQALFSGFNQQNKKKPCLRLCSNIGAILPTREIQMKDQTKCPHNGLCDHHLLICSLEHRLFIALKTIKIVPFSTDFIESSPVNFSSSLVLYPS